MAVAISLRVNGRRRDHAETGRSETLGWKGVGGAVEPHTLGLNIEGSIGDWGSGSSDGIFFVPTFQAILVDAD